MLRYYWRWLKVASFGHSWSPAEKAAGLVSILGPAVSWFLSLKDIDKIVSQLTWQVAIAVFIGLFVLRLVAAPYWMHQEDEAKREAEWAKEKEKRAELEEELVEGRIRQEALLAQRSQREEQETCLAELLSEGGRLKAQRVDNPDRSTAWMQEYKAWRMRIQAEVGRNFSPAVATGMLTLDAPIDRSVISFDGNHQQALACILAITQEMRAISRDLSTKN